MKKSLTILTLSIIFYSSCNKISKYQRHLILCENLVYHINSLFDESISSKFLLSNFYTEDFTFHYFPAGNKKGIKILKKDFLNLLNDAKKKIDLNIVHTIFLPGLDELTHKIDGSVRVYYGADIYYNNDTIEYSGYQTINFKNHKINEVFEWADYGGIYNLLNN